MSALFSKKPAATNEVKSQKKDKAEVLIKPKTGSGKKSHIDTLIILSPLITEKAAGMEQESKYVFKVASGANKLQIKDAIQKIYGVSVARVNISRLPGKTRRHGAIEGFKPGLKKAVVTLLAGQKIELMSK